MVATGSAKKRFDKAAKMSPKVLVGLRFDGETLLTSTRAAPGVEQHEHVKELVLRLVGA